MSEKASNPDLIGQEHLRGPRWRRRHDKGAKRPVAATQDEELADYRQRLASFN